MPDYFLILDATLFERRLRPALAESWRRRSFEPCREFIAWMLPRVVAFADRYLLGADRSLVQMVADGLAFERDFWRTLVGEALLYSAVDIPEFPTCLDTLCCLVSPEDREPMRQAHHGSRDLSFGAATYRPDACGLNDLQDVRRISLFLAGVDASAWQPEALTAIDEEERPEELAFARDWFPSIQEMYQRAAAENCVVVREFV